MCIRDRSAVAANNIIQQQKISVTGKVVDNLGEPIIGANVVVQGQTVGTITDIDGVFKLDVPKGAKLLISFIGYLSLIHISNPQPPHLYKAYPNMTFHCYYLSFHQIYDHIQQYHTPVSYTHLNHING